MALLVVENSNGNYYLIVFLPRIDCLTDPIFSHVLHTHYDSIYIYHVSPHEKQSASYNLPALKGKNYIVCLFKFTNTSNVCLKPKCDSVKKDRLNTNTETSTAISSGKSLYSSANVLNGCYVILQLCHRQQLRS